VMTELGVYYDLPFSSDEANWMCGNRSSLIVEYVCYNWKCLELISDLSTQDFILLSSFAADYISNQNPI
jgi:hypothetical protein